jgi:hypothetical protein
VLLKGGSDVAKKLIGDYYQKRDDKSNPISIYYNDGKDQGIESIIRKSYEEIKKSPVVDELKNDMQYIKDEITKFKDIEGYVSKLFIDAQKNPDSIESKDILGTSKESNKKIKEVILKKFPDIDVKSPIIDDIINSKNKDIKNTKEEIDSQIKDSSKESGGWEAKHYAMFLFAILISTICPLAGIVIFAKLPPINKDDNIYQRIKSINPNLVKSMEEKSEELKNKPWGKELIDSIYNKKDDIIKNKDNKEGLDKIINEAKKPILENMKKGNKTEIEIENTSKEMDDFIKKINIEKSIDSQNIDEFKSNINEAKEQELNLQYQNDPNKNAKIKEEMDKFYNEIEGVTSNLGEKQQLPISNVSNNIPSTENNKQKTQEPEIGSKAEEYLKRKNEEKNQQHQRQ